MDIVQKRCVLFLNGYEPLTVARTLQRLRREFERSARTWAVSTRVEEDGERPVPRLAVETAGPDWRVSTDFRLLYWGDLVLSDFARPQWQRLLGGALALMDFALSGTALRFFRTNWRYGAFFLYPFVLVAAAVAAGLWASRFAALAAPAIVAAGVGLAVAYGLTLWPGRRLFFGYLLDDWRFARDYARGHRPDLEERLDVFARELVEVLRTSDADEIVLAGHSLGAALKLDVIARALRLAPQLPRWPILLSTGSSLLKVALHPAARGLRAAVAQVADDDRIAWVEYQSVVDIISFYKVDPLAALGLPARGKPWRATLRIRAMLDPKTYRRFRYDFFRLHRQLVMGNERRHFYDFFMICCGPMTLRQRFNDPDAARDALAPDGRLAPANREGA